METVAVVLQEPERLTLSPVALNPRNEGDVVVDVEWSGISTGTERLLWSGRMPPFPGLGYPLVPGYESVGRVAEGPMPAGTSVFVPGASCFRDVRGLFGGAASRLVVPAERVIPLDDDLGDKGVLIALAATAHHALGGSTPELIVGHGVLGRLIARLSVLRGGAPTVWETQTARSNGAQGYTVVHPDHDDRRDYSVICEVSGDPSIFDSLVMRLSRGGEIVVAGFYDRISFDFPPAFMKEARLRIAAEFAPADLHAVSELVREGLLSLDGLITHRRPAADAADAYAEAFTDPTCLKMLLDWRQKS
ncbi:MAG: chlorophyll synthesis pathway protein BchC [Myxococcota bacterium]